MEIAWKFINLVHISEYEVPKFPRKRNGLLFSLFMEKMQQIVVLPFYFNKKCFVRYVVWKEGRIFLGTRNPYDVVIIHLFQCPLPIQELTHLFRHPRGILSKKKSFKNWDKIIKNFIKILGGFVPP
jgi:hypothetical protein